MNDNILPDSIQADHIVVFDLLAKQRLDAIQLDALLVYMIDTVDESALYYLADQFDVLGYKGWYFADTIEKKRNLIKTAIELHRFKGTVWAVKQAMATIGYPDAVLTEHVETGPNGWATFKISLDVGDNYVSSDSINELAKIINEYKNVRSHLTGIEISVVFTDDSVIITDDGYEAPALQDDDNVYAGGDFVYDGEHDYDGTMNYSNDTDYLEITITEI